MKHFTVCNEDEQVVIPNWVVDLETFRQWVHSDTFLEKTKVFYLQGVVWIDMSQKQVFTHLSVKTELTIVLGGLVKSHQMGLFFADGLFLSNVDADLAGNPDVTFIAAASLKSERVRFLEGKRGGIVEVEGSPDMVLEVVSRSSVRKDTVSLRKTYWEAGIREYWLVDARKDPLSFDILRHTPKGYVVTRPQGGWIKSAVFGKSFRLSMRDSERGHPEFTLDVR